MRYSSLLILCTISAVRRAVLETRAGDTEVEMKKKGMIWRAEALLIKSNNVAEVLRLHIDSVFGILSD